mgnify:CR=1 FL=1
MSEKYVIASAKTAKELGAAYDKVKSAAKGYGFSSVASLKEDVVGKAMTDGKKGADFVVEMGAILYDLGRQPRAARNFFVKWDRILFGKDAFQPEEYPYYWRVFETRDDYFDYYRDYHASWKLYGIDLPDAVLKKVYYGNALRITGRLPQGGFPR